MTRSERLLYLIDLLRKHRTPVTAETLADYFDVSVRTIYRDIDTLKQQGAEIYGEAGMGFILKHDFLLPPLMLNANEIEALVFGLRSVMCLKDCELADHAESIYAKVKAVLPNELQSELSEQSLYPVKKQTYAEGELQHITLIRQALRASKKLTLRYTDSNDTQSERTIWPVALGYWGDIRMLAAWCELRHDFRNFRTDRIQHLSIGKPFPTPKNLLLRRWEESEGITLQSFDH